MFFITFSTIRFIVFILNCIKLPYLYLFCFRSERALGNPIESGKIKSFCREKGHGFVSPEKGGEDIFLHISE